MSPKGIIIKELALVFSIARVFHFSADGNIPGENSNLGSHVHTIYDLTHVQELRGFWLTWARQEYQNKETTELCQKDSAYSVTPSHYQNLLPASILYCLRIPESQEVGILKII